MRNGEIMLKAPDESMRAATFKWEAAGVTVMDGYVQLDDVTLTQTGGFLPFGHGYHEIPESDQTSKLIKGSRYFPWSTIIHFTEKS